MLARLCFGQSSNLSDRFLAVMSGTQLGQGNSPQRVADYLKPRIGRDCYWTVNETDWPDAVTLTTPEPFGWVG